MGYPQRLSESAVAVVCARPNFSKPTQHGGKDNCTDFYSSTDPSCLPPPPLPTPSSNPQASPSVCCNACEIITDYKCLSPSQLLQQQDNCSRIRKPIESNGLEQRVILINKMAIICNHSISNIVNCRRRNNFIISLIVN